MNNENWNKIFEIYLNDKIKSTNYKIATSLLEIGSDVTSLKLEEFASQIKVAPSTVSKFLQKNGFEGWKTYVTFAYMSLVRVENNLHLDTLQKSKLNMLKWVDLHYKNTLKILSNKINESKEIIIIAHGATKKYLEVTKRNLSIIGINVRIVDLSDQYLDLPNKGHIIYIVVSLSGMSDYLPAIVNKLKKCNLSHKIFVSCSTTTFDLFETVVNIKSDSLRMDKIENIIPIVELTFLQHVFDRIIENVIIKNKGKIKTRFEDLGIDRRLKKNKNKL